MDDSTIIRPLRRYFSEEASVAIETVINRSLDATVRRTARREHLDEARLESLDRRLENLVEWAEADACKRNVMGPETDYRAAVPSRPSDGAIVNALVAAGVLWLGGHLDFVTVSLPIPVDIRGVTSVSKSVEVRE